MKKKFSFIVWIILVLLLSTWGIRRLDDFKVQRRVDQEGHDPGARVEVILVTYADESVPEETETGSLLTTSCGDYMVPFTIPASSTRLGSVLSALSYFESEDGLHNPFAEKGISLESIGTHKDGILEVRLTGDPVFGGICDLPRIRMQIDETIRLYEDQYIILLNGSDIAYECLGKGDTCIIRLEKERGR